MEIQVATFFLRLSVAVLMLWCALECWRTTKLLQNNSLKRIIKKIAFGIFAFAVGRLAALLLDNWLALGIGIFSNIVNYGFWFWVLYYLWKNRKHIQSESVGTEGRQRLSVLIDEFLVEINGRAKHLSEN